MGSIAGRRRVETALKAARVQAELAASSATEAMLAAQASNRAKSEFLANMSHELRTPLNAIMGFSEIISAETLGPVGTAKYLEYTRDISCSAEHLLAIINDILDLARIEAGKSELNDEPLEPYPLLLSCVRVVSERARLVAVTIAVEPPPTQFLLVADERKLKQIVINLLSNAVKFTPADGTVTLSCHLFAGQFCRLAVQDTGIGISAEDLPRVMQPFAQADTGLDRRFEGTGLGLPLTRGLVELHGGRLRLESELGRGTAAIIELPMSRVQTFEAEPAAARSPSPRSPVHQAIREIEHSLRTGFPSDEDNAAH